MPFLFRIFASKMSIKPSTLIVYVKGVAMGIADLVPGVSGGTIALITNIYEELISSINRVTVREIVLLFGANRKKSWQNINGPFLLPLFLGIVTSILFLSSVIQFLLENHSLALWSFFFGLILASSLLICKDIKHWSTTTIVGMILGGITSFIIGFLTPVEATQALPYLFLCGMFMIVAMVLPGISGAFILILLGAYDTALSTVEMVRSFQIQGLINLVAFGLGAIIGIKLFAHWVERLYIRSRNTLLATMSGFMLGSLYKVWPWTKAVTNQAVDRSFALPYISPSNADFWIGIVFITLGISIIFVFHKLRKKTHERASEKPL